MATATQSATVNDTTPPVISCPASTTVTANLGSNSAVVSYPAPTATDNCSVPTTSCSPPSGSSFPVGATTATCTATDTAGNMANCQFTVTVLTPQQAIQSIINTVNGLGLNPRNTNALIAKLQAAINQMNGEMAPQRGTSFRRSLTK